VTPSPTPTPSPDCRTLGCPPGEECLREGRCGGSDCFSCFPIPTPTPTPTATPTPQPTATPTPSPSPTPQPTPTPCVPSSSVQKVCVTVDGGTFPYTPNACWDCTSWTGYMVRNGYFTAGDPNEDGDVGGFPGHWKNSDAQQVLVGLIRKSDCAKVDPRSGNVTGVAIDPPYMEKRLVSVPCPTPTPTPGPSPSPTPGPGGPGCAMPAQCPALKIWRGKLHACQTANHQDSRDDEGKPKPVPNGKCYVDSTPGFEGSERGLPCNDEHNAVCSCTGEDLPHTSQGWRRCEDPRGPVFTVSGSGVARWEKQGFLAEVKLSGGGDVVVEICPPDPMRDALGQVVKVNSNPCRTVRWSF
jgi:hypothetical protein